MKKRIRVEIKPTNEQKEILNKTFGCCRFVYNKVLTDTIKEYQNYKNGLNKKPKTNGYFLLNKLPEIVNNLETLWLSEVSSVALQQTLINLSKAYSNFFKTKVGFPKFKNRYSNQSFNLAGKYTFSIKDNCLELAKIKTSIKVYWDKRGVPMDPTSVTITKSKTNRYYASFVVESIPKIVESSGSIGIDLGLTHFATLSNGAKINNPRCFNKYQKKLRRAQQSFSRKQKGSKNKSKAGHYVAKIHEKIANSRDDFIHKTTTDLVNKYKVIGIETLKSKNMVKNKNLSKAISDVAWGKFKETLLQKVMATTDSTLVFMDTFYPSSHICHETDRRITGKLKLSQRSFKCEHCLQTHDRDINAAKTIERKAMSAYSIVGDIKPRFILADNQYLR